MGNPQDGWFINNGNHVYIIYIYKRLYIQLFSTTPVPKKVQRQLSLLNVAGNWDGTMRSGTL